MNNELKFIDLLKSNSFRTFLHIMAGVQAVLFILDNWFLDAAIVNFLDYQIGIFSYVVTYFVAITGFMGWVSLAMKYLNPLLNSAEDNDDWD